MAIDREALRRRVFDEFGDILIVTDEKEDIVAASHSVGDLLGRTPDELVGSPFQSLLPERLRSLRDGHFLAHILSRPPTARWSAVRAPVLQRNGVEREVYVKARFLAGDPSLRLVCLSTLPEQVEIDDPEISKLIVSDGKTRVPAGDRLYRVVVENAPLGIFHFDRTGRLTACNQQFVQIIGSSRKALVGLRTLTLRDKAVVECIRRTLEGEHTFYEGDYASTTAPKVTPVRVHFAPVHDEGGAVAGGVGIIEDITDRKREEETRARLYAQAQAALRARDDFLSIASHELKTPLTSLALRLDMLERNLRLGRPVDVTTLGRAKAHLERMSRLIGDLLDASRSESDGLGIHPELTRLETVVEHAVQSRPQRLGAAVVRYLQPDEPLYARVDAGRIEQVVTNLVDNALKYSPEGNDVEVGLSAHGDLAVLSVKDRGIGIPPEEQERLFDRYFRGRNASMQTYGGLGLGLYIVREIVERHGGRIWLESEVGRGTTFFVALPRVLQPGADRTAQPAPA